MKLKNEIDIDREIMEVFEQTGKLPTSNDFVEILKVILVEQFSISCPQRDKNYWNKKFEGSWGDMAVNLILTAIISNPTLPPKLRFLFSEIAMTAANNFMQKSLDSLIKNKPAHINSF